ncbi:hypothetical protein [Methylobacterium sp. Leaf117]|uniref:hypothetical protein n=1 Tax=Methylobacterium sp. Leaf117 TaxID=1736260 RepID=UPI0006FCFE2C|nr:hypothetical protein [Methylobacterium sp. Leaf117]KQP89827.1 hypothetical protein ASF57_23620 [Methylobacterium sp. Leaf117]
MAREYRLNPKVEIPEGVTLDKPGIYEWAITYPDGSIRRYVGKYTRRSRPMREYRANVERILDKRPYRKASPEGFRQVHRELATAASEGRMVVLTILENVLPEDLNRREQALIRERGATLNGSGTASAATS